MTLWQRAVSWFRPKSQIAKTCRELDPWFRRFMDDLSVTSYVLSDINNHKQGCEPQRGAAPPQPAPRVGDR